MSNLIKSYTVIDFAQSVYSQLIFIVQKGMIISRTIKNEISPLQIQPVCRLYYIGTYFFLSKAILHKINHNSTKKFHQKIEDECKKIQALDQLNHSLGLGSIHLDTLKFTVDIIKMQGEEGCTFLTLWLKHCLIS